MFYFLQRKKEATSSDESEPPSPKPVENEESEKKKKKKKKKDKDQEVDEAGDAGEVKVKYCKVSQGQTNDSEMCCVRNNQGLRMDAMLGLFSVNIDMIIMVPNMTL